MKIEGVTKIASKVEGPSLAIFAGVHGNERAGVYAIEKLKNSLKPTKGIVYLVQANLPAIENDVRMINKNLNRCFMAENNGNLPEDKRARELMQILDECDALLDLHMFYDESNEPFVICEENAIDIAKIFDVSVISTNWTQVEPGGTDGYMFLQNKVGICLECGPLTKSEEYTVFAEKAIFQFLQYYDMSPEVVDVSTKKKRLVKALKAVNKTSDAFKLMTGFKDFQTLMSGQLIAEDKKQNFTAQAGQCIVFPHYNARVGEEAYIIAAEVSGDI